VDTIAKECSEAGYGYRYKDILPVGLLGLVDDTIGVTEAENYLLIHGLLNMSRMK
jgi:hypothetical protein